MTAKKKTVTSKVETFKLKVKNFKKPDYLEINGVGYERMNDGMAQIELELNKSTIKQLEGIVKSGGYVNYQEAVRDILRQQVGVAKRYPPMKSEVNAKS